MHNFISLSSNDTNTQIILRNPDLSSYDTLDFKTRFERNMDGTWRTNKSTPVTRVHHLMFKNMTQAKKYEMITFIQQNEGLQLVYIDWFSQTWHVQLIQKTVSFITVDTTGVDMSLQLENNE